MLPSAISRSDSFRSVHVGRSRFSLCCHLFVALWFCSWSVEPGPGHSRSHRNSALAFVFSLPGTVLFLRGCGISVSQSEHVFRTDTGFSSDIASSIERANSVRLPFCSRSSVVRRSLSRNLARFAFRGGASVSMLASGKRQKHHDYRTPILVSWILRCGNLCVSQW